jgi:trk system potassium uptake protein TrkH
MRFRIVSGILGTLLKILGILMLVPGIVSTIYDEMAGVAAFALASMLAISTGIFLRRFSSEEDPGNKEAFGVVALGWLFAAFFGALPFLFLGLSLTDSLFESISGFSATGATILTERNLEGYYILNETLADQSLASNVAGILAGAASANLTYGSVDYYVSSGPHTYFGLLFWRSFSQLIGGMGIILLYVAILPHLGVAGRQLFMAETVGPIKDTIAPRAKQTARILWGVYLLFVAAMIAMLVAAGMPVFDSICTAFSALATGGFSPRADSIAYYNSIAIDAIVMFFVFLGATSFTLHYHALHQRDIRGWLRDPELRFFVLLLSLATIALVLFGRIEGDPLVQFRFAAFQVVSFMGTCGFVNTLTYDSWSAAAKLVLIIAMLIGGCAGSTAGGLKAVRLLIALKYAYNELFHLLHPKAFLSVRVGKESVAEDVLRPILFYSFFYLAVWLALSLLLAMASVSDPRVDLLVATSGVASCMGGVGPGFGIIAFDWSQISNLGKLIGFFCMYIGRLELLPVFLLFVPDLWRK